MPQGGQGAFWRKSRLGWGKVSVKAVSRVGEPVTCSQKTIGAGTEGLRAGELGNAPGSQPGARGQAKQRFYLSVMRGHWRVFKHVAGCRVIRLSRGEREASRQASTVGLQVERWKVAGLGNHCEWS